MPGIRLHPNYHGYDLEDPLFAELLSMAARRGLIVQLALKMEDERMQHPLMRVPSVAPAPLPELVKSTEGLRLMILHWKGMLTGQLFRRLAAAGQVYFEISMLDSLGTLDQLAEDVSIERVLFGSNYPLFYFESAVLKVREASLAEPQRQAIFEGNARRLSKGTNR